MQTFSSKEITEELNAARLCKEPYLIEEVSRVVFKVIPNAQDGTYRRGKHIWLYNRDQVERIKKEVRKRRIFQHAQRIKFGDKTRKE